MFHLPNPLAICVKLLLPGIPLHSGEGILHPDQAFGFVPCVAGTISLQN